VFLLLYRTNDRYLLVAEDCSLGLGTVIELGQEAEQSVVKASC